MSAAGDVGLVRFMEEDLVWDERAFAIVSPVSRTLTES